MSYRVCLIEDDELLGEALVERLELAGFACTWHKTGASALRALRNRCCHVVVSDIQLPDIDGETLYRKVTAEAVPPPFLFITGFGGVDQAVRLLKLGAEDYLTKPFDVPQLIERLQALCARLAPAGGAIPLLGVSPGMRAIEASLPRIAASASTVLIRGESGVGKEYVARALHGAGEADGQRPFVAVNCGAIPETLMEAELFGHTRGAFTGAVRDKRGVFEQAAGGTLFLDEIGDMPPLMQVKLLRALQERRVTPLGAERDVAVDLRLVCATHRDLAEMVAEGTFREDLYYRVNVVAVEVPPLRERPEDILWHARRILDDLAAAGSVRACALSPLAEKALLAYPWPGNIRELRNRLERASVLAPSAVLTPEVLFGDAWRERAVPFGAPPTERLVDHLQQCERDYILRVLDEHGGRIGDSAAALGISRKTLWDKMKKLGLSGDGGPAA
ncbi:sigma-54-dependent transcriptional regulator [Aromatoleum toluclasticum]|uniref:sigma-54-dependent transcriptional regulator n=1 Tax=Aromatoleum toluclasticum TaxID=92003 RepID=UPI0003656565|nr:sigma-54 dependent transcriptional regulator [Aromatoleum toluclasticum]